MNTTILKLFLAVLITQFSFAQSKAEEELIDLSKQKWQWMADKNVEKLSQLFHDQSVFVHMGGSWGKEKRNRYHQRVVGFGIRKLIFKKFQSESLRTPQYF